ncbi:Uncharacterized protein FWK35_00013125 [Aphis craccivora]|uniref:Uncharacterized protein n=1 Tax=Aphis craccivora TaxID=307492 RepID=A0A6G0YYG5_APHCR|nr:Uncharacterized protein FWK35_00013125 [Aphis craccivora]
MNVLILQCCVFFFFLCLCTRESVKIMQTMGVISNSKMNLVGILGRSFLNFKIVFKSPGKKPKKKLRKNGNFYAKQFSTKSIFLYGFNSKTYHCKYLKISSNVYVSVIYKQLNFQKLMTFFELFIDH